MGMVTNGLYMTRERFRRLLASGLHTATVSLDGFAADHNWMREIHRALNVRWR